MGVLLGAPDNAEETPARPFADRRSRARRRTNRECSHPVPQGATLWNFNPAERRTPLMSSHELPCPIWSDAPMRLNYEQLAKLKERGLPFNSPHAGGHFVLKQSGAPLLDSLTDRQKAHLSYWIYHHNFQPFRQYYDSPEQGGKPPVLDKAWVESHRNLAPLASDRMLTFLCEVIRSDDAREGRDPNLLYAAGGCSKQSDLAELEYHAAEQGWMGVRTERGVSKFTNRVNLPARIYVEEQLRKRGLGRQGFVAMWFDPSMNEVYEDGIKPAIEAAGYKPHKIDQEAFLGPIVDRIVAEIRKSRFVVADFTTSPECGDRGGVYYEAGFAHGLGIPVIHTCRKDSMKALHFDTNHLNHLIWTTPEELKHRLKYWIEATIEPGPRSSSNGRPGSRRFEFVPRCLNKAPGNEGTFLVAAPISPARHSRFNVRQFRQGATMRLAAFTDSGYFWLPSDEDRSFQVPGTLAVSEAGIVTLETFGYPSRDPLSLAHGSFGQAGSNLTRVFGYTRERGAVTLVNGICTQSGRQSAASGVSFASSAILAETLLAGGPLRRRRSRFSTGWSAGSKVCTSGLGCRESRQSLISIAIALPSPIKGRIPCHFGPATTLRDSLGLNTRFPVPLPGRPRLGFRRVRAFNFRPPRHGPPRT